VAVKKTLVSLGAAGVFLLVGITSSIRTLLRRDESLDVSIAGLLLEPAHGDVATSPATVWSTPAGMLTEVQVHAFIPLLNPKNKKNE